MRGQGDHDERAAAAGPGIWVGGSGAGGVLPFTYFVPQPSTLNDFDKAICIVRTADNATGSLRGSGGS